MPKVIITVPPRPEFQNAYWALGRKFDSGTTILDVTDEQLVELKGQPVMGVTLASEVNDATGGDAGKSQADANTDAGHKPLDAGAEAAKVTEFAKPVEADASKSPGKPLKR